MPVGDDERSTLLMVDMPALAARQPSVAAALQAAGLTAQQHDAYRVALASAKLTGLGEQGGEPDARSWRVEPTSTLGKNVAFVHAHPDETAAFAWGDATGTRMWYTP